MPLGVLQTYDNAERVLLHDSLKQASGNYPARSVEYMVLSKAMADSCAPDPTQRAEEYSKSELRELYVLLARANCAYDIESEEFHVLTKAMADFREQM